MSEYTHILGVTADGIIPAVVREQIADSSQLEDKFVRLEDDELLVGDDPISVDPSPVAGLNVVGWVKGVFVETGDTVPVDAGDWTVVFEVAP